MKPGDRGLGIALEGDNMLGCTPADAGDAHAKFSVT
jgi:hypothetical protein